MNVEQEAIMFREWKLQINKATRLGSGTTNITMTSEEKSSENDSNIQTPRPKLLIVSFLAKGDDDIRNKSTIAEKENVMHEMRVAK